MEEIEIFQYKNNKQEEERMRKKAAAIIIATTMLAGLTACGGQGDTGAQASTSSGQTASQTDTQTTQENTERPKVSVLTVDFSGNALAGENADKVKEYVDEFTQTDVEWNFGLSDAYADKLTLMLASGNATPMIVTATKMDAQIVNYAKAGAFWDLSQFINEQDYPNLAKANPDVNEYVTIDGQLIGIYRSRPMARYGFSYREDWAEKLGYTKEPETIDEVYQMMYDFTYGDPDGNGKDDTYGLELCSYTGSLDIMQTWFGVGNKWYEDESGKILPVHMSEEYMEALDWFKKCYDNGLWASDWATRETSTWTNDVKNGLAGMYCDTVSNGRKIWDYFIDNEIPSVVDSSKTASMVLGHSIGKTPETRHNNSNSGYGGFLVITKSGAKTEEDVKNCLHFLDRMCEDEMKMVANYVVEGLHWEKDANGYYVNLMQDESKQQDFAGVSQVEPGIPSSDISESYIKFELSETKKKENEVVADNEKYVVVNPALSLLIQSETYTVNGAVLDTILDDARTNYIIGVITKEQLEEQWKLWATSGGDKVIEEINAAR